MILRRRFKRKPVRIEMVPLIDIVFLLLVFFIYAMLSMAVHRGMNVDLPESVSSKISEEVSLSISVQYENGEAFVFLNKERLPLHELDKRLRMLAQQDDMQKEVLLFADKSVPYQELYRVLDRISAAGITAISLQAEQKR